MVYYLGEIRIFAGSYAPNGWHFCDGTLLSISQYTALYTLLGTTYGGDGQTTFKLPNMTARVGVGIGQLTGGKNYDLGQVGGVTDVTLTEATLPSHNHTVRAYTGNATSADPRGATVLATSVPGNQGYSSVKLYSALPSTQTEPDSPLDSQAVLSTGDNMSHTNMMPYTTINFIIALDGMYPEQT